MAENDPTKNPAEGAPTEGAKKPEDAAPKFMTAEDYNKAATAREKRLLNQIQEMFKSAQAPKKPDDEPADETTDETTDDEIVDETVEEEKPAKKPAAKPGLSKAEIAAKKANEKAERALREAKAEREKAAKEKADASAREEKLATQAALVQAQAVNQKQALAVLKSENRIKRDEATGELVFIMPRDIAGEKFDEELPLADGIKEWLASDEGKLYAPPKNVEGSGAGTQGKQKSLKEMSKGDRKKAAGATLLKWAMNR